MNNIYQILLAVFISLGLQCCVPKVDPVAHFPQKIKKVYFRKGSPSSEVKDSQTKFYIEFEKPLSKDIRLQTVYFQGQQANVQPLTDYVFLAQFTANNDVPDLILHKDSSKEYGNKPPNVSKPKYNVKGDSALLEYRRNGRIFLYTIVKPYQIP